MANLCAIRCIIQKQWRFIGATNVTKYSAFQGIALYCVLYCSVYWKCKQELAGFYLACTSTCHQIYCYNTIMKSYPLPSASVKRVLFLSWACVHQRCQK